MVALPLKDKDQERFLFDLTAYTEERLKSEGRKWAIAQYKEHGNVDGPTDRGFMVMFWDGPDQEGDYQDLHIKGFMRFLWNAFSKLDIELEDGWWINISNMDDETWVKFYEEMESWHEVIRNDREDTSIYYAVDHLPEYEKLYQEELDSATKYWWEDHALRRTPFESLPESYYESPGSWEYEENEESGSIYYHAPEWGEAADQIMDIITNAANKGDMDIDEDDLEEFYAKPKNEAWTKYRIRKCPVTGLWARQEDMIFFVDSWVMPYIPRETHKVLPLFKRCLADDIEEAVRERMSWSTRLYSVTKDMVFAANNRVRYEKHGRRALIEDIYVHCRAFRIRIRPSWQDRNAWEFDVLSLQVQPGYEDDISESHFAEAQGGKPFPSYLFRKADNG
jgi:hypothetical protein